MKKLFVLTTILLTFLAISSSFSCEKGYFCCEDQHSPTTQCSICGAHPETTYDTNHIPTLLVFVPTFIRNIFFQVIHIEEMNYIPVFDRPPTKLS